VNETAKIDIVVSRLDNGKHNLSFHSGGYRMAAPAANREEAMELFGQFLDSVQQYGTDVPRP
jgi:hypothetical protein